MIKIKLEVELMVDDYIYNQNDKEETKWFFDEVLKNGDLTLHENDCVGDTIGIIKILKIYD
jgi:hypothetical protein